MSSGARPKALEWSPIGSGGAGVPLTSGNYFAAQAVLLREMEDERSAAARRLASLRRVYTKTCPICGSEFEGIAKRMYDTHACQVKAYRQRRKQREAAVN